MEITLRQREYHKYLTVLKILKNLSNPEVKPFNQLRNRELEVFAILLYYYNNKYKAIPEAEKNQLIFSYDTRKDLCTLLGNVSDDVMYNILMGLRKRGLITKKSMVKRYILPDYLSFKINFDEPVKETA